MTPLLTEWTRDFVVNLRGVARDEMDRLMAETRAAGAVADGRNAALIFSWAQLAMDADKLMMLLDGAS